MSRKRFLTRFASGALVASVVSGTMVVLGGVANAQVPNLGTLTLTPSVGSDLSTVTARTSAGCPQPDPNDPDNSADSSQMFINGPDETTGTKTFPDASPYPIVSNTSASFSNTGPFDLPFKLTLKDAAQAAQDPVFGGSGTLQPGTYHLTEHCINGFNLTDFGTFTTTFYLTTPTLYQDTDPATNPKQSITQLTVAPPSPVNQGTAATLTARVNRPNDANGAPAAGSVEFKDGGTVLGSAPVAANSLATLSGQTLALGTHPLTATFIPTDTTQFTGSTSLTVNYVVVVATTTTLTVSPASPAPFGTKETLTSTVTATSGTPAGSVQFV
ncbi:MAG TPA: Ig-like domain-containing protein, partial [Pseudonocardiaceae bacterium]|nr:Ig-like domain-containing protein [Pseudonocardiaceae bacterium]